jgi:hypothetical protein
MLVWAHITPILANSLISCWQPGTYPGLWWQNKVVFFSKPGKELSLACSWWQIMISMLARNYSNLLDGKLRRVTCLASHKTGLTTVSGCHTNLTTLSDSINWKEGVPTNIVKASDTMPHIHTCLSPPTRTTSTNHRPNRKHVFR